MLDDLHQLAVAALTTELAGRIPPPPQDVTFELFLSPKRFTPTGLGNFVGRHDDPLGSITGVRLAAEALVTVTVVEPADLNPAIAQLTSTLLAQDPAALRLDGIFRWQVSAIEPNPAGPLARDVRFDVLYEFIRLPEAGEGIIETIPIDLTLA